MLFCPRCEPFSTYPRTYDFIHVTDIESLLKNPGSSKNRYLYSLTLYLIACLFQVFEPGVLGKLFSTVFSLNKRQKNVGPKNPKPSQTLHTNTINCKLMSNCQCKRQVDFCHPSPIREFRNFIFRKHVTETGRTMSL